VPATRRRERDKNRLFCDGMSFAAAAASSLKLPSALATRLRTQGLSFDPAGEKQLGCGSAA